MGEVAVMGVGWVTAVREEGWDMAVMGVGWEGVCLISYSDV